MLVDFYAVNARQIERFARLHHRFRQPGNLPVGHIGIEDCHEKSRHLIVGYLTARISIHEIGNLFGGQFTAVALSVNQVYCTHYEALSVPFRGIESKGRPLTADGPFSLSNRRRLPGFPAWHHSKVPREGASA